jgi:hypothetical protein
VSLSREGNDSEHGALGRASRTVDEVTQEHLQSSSPVIGEGTLQPPTEPIGEDALRETLRRIRRLIMDELDATIHGGPSPSARIYEPPPPPPAEELPPLIVLAQEVSDQVAQAQAIATMVKEALRDDSFAASECLKVIEGLLEKALGHLSTITWEMESSPQHAEDQ